MSPRFRTWILHQVDSRPEYGSRRLICVEDQEREEEFIISGCLYALHSCQEQYDCCYVFLLPRAGLAVWTKLDYSSIKFTFCIWDELCNGFCVCDFSFVFNAF
jgi:hypothetical protein